MKKKTWKFDSNLLATKLWEFREDNDLSMLQASEAAGIAKTTWRMCEGGQQPGDLNIFLRLCSAIGSNPNLFFK